MLVGSVGHKPSCASSSAPALLPAEQLRLRAEAERATDPGTWALGPWEWKGSFSRAAGTLLEN